MSDFPKERFVSGALPKKQFPMSASHETSQGFMQIAPTLCMDVVPGSSGKLTVKSFSRVDPMKVPCLGSVTVRNRAFQVRLPSLWRPFYSFISDTTYQSSNSSFIPSNVPYFNMCLLMSLLTNTYYSTQVQGITDPLGTDRHKFDFAYRSDYYKLTALGRYVYKILKGLGYDLVAVGANTDVFYVSAMRLLGYVKILVDWYYPSQYIGLTSDYVDVVKIFQRENVFSLSANDLQAILTSIVYCCYDRDYFISAWDQPVSPSSGAFSGMSLVDVTLDSSTPGSDRVYTATNGTPVSESTTTTGVGVVSQYNLTMLHALTSYMKRHQIAGAMALDRWLADFGLQIRSDKLGRSVYCGSDVFPLQIGDVMSHSDTSGAALGEYAGKGVAYTEGHTFEFDAKEDFCYVMVINTVVPDTGYVQGFDRHNLDYNRLQFFQPSFDGKGPQAISAVELFVSNANDRFNDWGGSVSRIVDVIFGWTQRYSHYKFLRSNLSGDFAVPSVNVGLDSWHLNRMFTEASFNDVNANIKHSPNFVKGLDADQYYRIFNITDPSLGDPFKFTHHFYVDMSAPMLPMYSDYIFHEERQEGRKDVEIDNAGAKMN